MKGGELRMEEQKNEGNSIYGKRPLWQWIGLYVVIAGILYTVIYFGFIQQKNSYSYNGNANATAATKQTQNTQNSVYKMTSKDKIGMVVSDSKGMTLYTYATDTSGVSNCTGACLKVWPAYVASSQSNLPVNISVIKRNDGTLQYAWKGMPLYYYAKDGDSGDAYGNGVGGVWSVIKSK